MTHGDREELPLRRYIAVLRRNWALVAAVIIVVTGAAILYTVGRPARYRAESVVLVNRQSIANQLSGSSADVGLQQQSFQQVLATQARLAREPSVIDRVLRATGSGISASALSAASSVEVDPSTDLLLFNVTDRNSRVARGLANNYANAYVAYRLDLDTSALRRAVAEVDNSLTEARATESEGLIASLQTSRQQLQTRLALQTANAQVVSVAKSTTPAGPGTLVTSFAGAIVGVVLSVLLVALRVALDTRVRTAEAAAEILGVPVLGRIPRHKGAGLAIIETPGSSAAEAFRIIRASLAFSIQTRDATTVMVTSASAGDGKSTTVANLAVAFAAAGKNVVVVDLDLRLPQLSILLNVDGRKGLTTVLTGDSSLQDALQEVSFPAGASVAQPAVGGRLYALASGPTPPNPSEVLGFDRTASAIAALRDRFDIVLLDSPPVLGLSDVLAISEYADIAVVCVRAGRARRPALRQLGQVLRGLDLTTAGVVMVDDGTVDTDYYSRYAEASAAPSAPRQAAASTSTT